MQLPGLPYDIDNSSNIRHDTRHIGDTLYLRFTAVPAAVGELKSVDESDLNVDNRDVATRLGGLQQPKKTDVEDPKRLFCLVYLWLELIWQEDAPVAMLWVGVRSDTAATRTGYINNGNGTSSENQLRPASTAP